MSAPRVQRVLPDACADLIIYNLDRAQVVGLYDEVALPSLPAGAQLRGIRFRPTAVAAAFRTHASSLRNQSVPADDVFGSKGARRLTDTKFLDLWIRSIKPDPGSSAAVNLLATSSVDEVAKALGLSGRHLRRLLLTEVGLPPKKYQEVLRLQRFVQALDGGTQLAAAAAAAGYSDQSHAARDVRRFCGLTPLQLLNERRVA